MAETPESSASAESADLPAGTNIGGYLIDAKIGEGGMGVVYGAHHPRIGKRVAIKILARAFCGDPAVVERFEQEARVVNEIKHPNIVDVFQFGELADKRSFFVMEWLDGEPLTARIERGRLPAREVIEILDVVADALQAAHEHHVIHRDLKSDNIFLMTSRGKRTVKLLDFGLAKLSARGTEGAPVGRTKEGIVVGTPAYMSPEQARGKMIDGRTDIYALGVLAFKMLTGALPFKADNAMDLIVQQLNAPPPQAIKLAPQTPPALSRLVVRMMAKMPDERPTLVEIRAAFAELLEGHAPKQAAGKPDGPVRAGVRVRLPEEIERDAAASAPAKEPAPPSSRRGTKGALLGAMVLLVAVIGAGAYVLKTRHGGTAAAPGPAASAGGDVKLTVTAESVAPTAGSAGSAGSADQATIEFDPDPVGSAAGSAAHHHHHTAKATGSGAGGGSDDIGDAYDGPVISNKPGGIIVTLEHASTIEIDGKVVAQGLGGRFDVPAGHHSIRIKAADRSPVARDVDVEAGGTAIIRIADDPGPVTQPEPAAGSGSASP